MAEDDIYGSKEKYDRFKTNLSGLTEIDRPYGSRGDRKYICKNPENLEYFRRLCAHFEARDISFIRRVRLFQSLRLICHLTFKDLSDCTRQDIDGMVAAMHDIYKTVRSKQTFITDIKYFWRVLFPECDSQGRPDETAMPYPVRHLSGRIDISRQKLRKDKITYDDFCRYVDYFGSDPRIQAFLTMALENLARPQELLYRRIGNIEAYDSYAKINLDDHGKEGPGILQCIDSFPYLLKWLNVHPQKNDPEAFIFINTGKTNMFRQLRPQNINKMLKSASRALGIQKPITCYSLKRNGVTIRRIRGESDMDIQHAARWKSTKQLRTYDMSDHEDALRRQLEKRGLVPASNPQQLVPRICAFCDQPAGAGELVCQRCQRPFDGSAIRQEVKKRDGEMQSLRDSVDALTGQLETLRRQVLLDLADEIRDAKRLQSLSTDENTPAGTMSGALVAGALGSPR